MMSTQEKPDPPEPAGTGLSIGLEVLLDQLAAERAARAGSPDFDLLIVGSGYGGAAAAAQLSACTDAEGRALRIAVLERGREYRAGQFPSQMADLPGHVRFAKPGDTAPRGRREGLFDLRLGPDLCVAVANGLGGGSLINAGVMEPALDAVFGQPPWPQGIRGTPAPLREWYAQAARLLGAVDARGANTIDRLGPFAPRRAEWLAGLHPTVRRPALTLALDPQPVGPAGLDLQRCIACGDCATGCNFGAKQSLDTSLLLQAAQRGVRLVSGAAVLRVLPVEDGWRVELNHTDEFLQRRQIEPLVLSARRVILAAGSLGSTEILLRSRAAGLPLSDRLGEQFSGNGDVLAAAVQLRQPLNALADEAQAPAARQVGPTITAMLDQRAASGFVVQDIAIPGPLRWLFEESFALAGCLDGLARGDDSAHTADPGFDDPHCISPAAAARILPLAIIGHDAALGRLTLAEDAAEGLLSVDWPGARSDARVDQRHAWLAAQLDKQGARLLANPLWRLLPPALEHLLGGARGPMLSVHPLGGCAMGDSAAEGVVDEWGQAYSGQGSGTAVHAGLVVLDGAIVPASLGINPALTITALALRALAQLKVEWGLAEQHAALPKPTPRPVYRVVAADAPAPAAPTVVEIRERLAGFVRLPGAPGGELKYAEFTFVYAPVAVRELLQPGPKRKVEVAPGRGHGQLRLFDAAPDPDAPGRLMIVQAGSAPGAGKLWRHAERRDADARWIAPLPAAELRLFHRAPRSASARRWHGLSAWVRNRGWRDSLQFLFEAWTDNQPPVPNPPRLAVRIAQQLRDAWALASRAGELRLMDYRIEIGRPPGEVPAWALPLVGQVITGEKRLSYTRRGNPWKQLSTLHLRSGPFQPLAGDRAARLELCLFYLARQRVPLMRLVQAQDSPSAMRDIGSLMGFVARLLVSQQVWTFRKPDAAPPREIRRLPGDVPGLPAPEIIELAVGRRGDAGASRRPIGLQAADDTPVLLRLTRYRGARAGARPILMLHGYSASGTSFAHHAVRPGPAKILWDAGWDVWLLDLRTSAGLPSARLPWTFEEAALNDIPVAVDHVVKATGAEQIDVLAHCMGSVMLHMALLEPLEQACERFFPLRQRLRGRIRRLVVSQVTPKMIFSPANTLRAFMMQHLRQYLPLGGYAFRVEGPPGLADQLIDRLLASLPYPDEEFDIENPPFPSWKKTPWTATRHRMDLLYGRDFALGNIDPAVLDAIDDHFGPLNLDTVAQAIHFARSNEITDWRGASLYLDDLAKSLALLQSFQVLSVHGQDNGLCEAESAELTAEHFEHVAPGRYRFHVVPGHGHQDCLIGRHAATRVFPAILRFLEEPDSADEPAAVAAAAATDGARPPSAMSAQTPLIRSESALGDDGRVHVLTALRPRQGWPRLWAWLPVRWHGEGGVEPLAVGEQFGQGLRILPFERGTQDIAEPLRQPLPIDWFPPAADGEQRGLLGLFIYAHPQALPLEGGNEALLDEPDLAELCQVLRERVDEGGPELALGLVPDPRAVDDGELRFLLAACQYPPGLLDHSPEALAQPGRASPAEASIARLVAFCRRHPEGRHHSLLIFAGDQIYADASSGLFDPKNRTDRYARPYMDFKSGLIRHLPPSVARIVHLPDDHEIEDGWEPIAGAGQPQGDWYATGRQAAWTHRWNPLPGPVEPERFWHQFDWRGACFFIGDSRTEREARRADRWDEARMVSASQSKALRQWLKDTHGRPRFVVTSALLLPRRQQTRDHPASALRSDAWDGYPASLHALLADLWDAQAQGVVFLSGDEHRSGFVSATVEAIEDEARPVRLHSIHSSGLYSPWPFAITTTEDFASQDAFTFPGPEGQVLRCRVTDWVDHPGDGFAALRVAGGRLELRFDRAGRPLHGAGDTVPDGVFELL